MALNYILEALSIKEGQQYYACVVDRHTVGLEELAALMCGRGSALTDTQVLAVFTELSHVVAQELAKGNAVHTPLGCLSLSIGGAFADASDRYDPARHRLKLSLRPSPALSGALKSVAPAKRDAARRQPVIESIAGYTAGGTPGPAVGGGACLVSGSGLRQGRAKPSLYALQNGRLLGACALLSHTADSMVIILPAGLEDGRALIRLEYARPGKSPSTAAEYELEIGG